MSTAGAGGPDEIESDSQAAGLTEAATRNWNLANQCAFKHCLWRHVFQSKFKRFSLNTGQITDFKCQDFDLGKLRIPGRGFDDAEYFFSKADFMQGYLLIQSQGEDTP